MTHFRLSILLALVLLLFAGGCSKQPRSTADIPVVFSHRYSIAVMPFSQPTDTGSLITGQLPSNQGIIPADQLMLLDSDLEQKLLAQKKDRVISFHKEQPPLSAQGTSFHTASQPQALPGWVSLGKQTGKDFILVPMVLNWHDREGSKAGVTNPAEVQLEFYLIRTDTGTIYNHAVFEERQVGLTSNLLSMGEFVKRKGAWVTARELADEGMDNMLKKMGLISSYAK